LPAYLKSLEKKLAAAEAASPPPDNLPRLRQLVEADRFFLEQKTNARHTFPTKTFKDRLDIDLGGRQVQVLHHERAVTPGDVFLYLPKEKVLITGDVLVNPIALERLDALDAPVIVPGHAPMKSITAGDPALAEMFGVYLVDWYLHRMYDKLDGPLTDDISRIPQHNPAGD
jgi:glyoxylase-like metal-dependent hydrolase (beta-lactamase superfamily II)